MPLLPDPGRVSWRNSELALAAAIGLGTLWLCLGSLDPRSDGVILGNDVLPYAQALVGGDPAARIDPAHLLFHPLASVVRDLLGLMPGAPGGMLLALRAQQVLSAFGAAAAAVIVFRFAAGLCGALRGALLAGLFAASAGNWLYGAVGETYLPATAATAGLLVAALRMRLGLEEERAGPVFGWLFLAVLLRQDSVLVLPALALLVSRRTLVRAAGGAGAAALALYAGAWVASGSEASFVHWLRGLANTGLWGRAPDLGALKISAGLTLASFTYLTWFWERLAPLAVTCTGLLLLPLFPPRSLGGGFRLAAGACIVHLVVRMAFFTWWQPGNMEYATGHLLPVFLLAAVVMRPTDQGWRFVRQPVLHAACLYLLVWGNWTVLIEPNRGHDLADRAVLAAEIVEPGGLVIALDPWQHFALVREELEGVEIEDASAAAGSSDPSPWIPGIVARIDAALARGDQAILVTDRVLPRRLERFETWPIHPDLLPALREGHKTTEIRDADDNLWAVLIQP